MVEIKTGNVGRDCLITRAHSLKPHAVMAAQRFPHREPHQARAVPLIEIPLIADLIKLNFS